MFRESSEYTLHTEVACGLTHYFVSFEDGVGVYHEIEVSDTVYHAFLQFTVQERSLRHWDERHREQSEVYDETLNRRAINPQKSLDEIVFTALRHEQLHRGIAELPEKQKRRFILYYEYGLSGEQIAVVESCKRQVISRSIEKARINLQKFLKNFE